MKAEVEVKVDPTNASSHFTDTVNVSEVAAYAFENGFLRIRKVSNDGSKADVFVATRIIREFTVAVPADPEP